MKKMFPLTLLSLFSTFSFGQKIYFSDTSNIWNLYYVNHGDDVLTGNAFIDKYVGDTILHGISYKKFQSSSVYFVADHIFIREDTSVKKVFAIAPVHDTDTAEVVLYDYNLQVGDTFKTPYTNHVVSGMDSVIINGGRYKIWYLAGCGPDSMYISMSYTVIEGIGCITEALLPLTAITFTESNEFLRCFTNNGVTSPFSHGVNYDFVGYFDNVASCTNTFGVNEKVETNNLNNKTRIASVSPNPVDKTSKINCPYNIRLGRMIICNDVGETVVNTTFQNKEELSIGDNISIPGVYFYRVTDDGNGQVFSGKFICR